MSKSRLYILILAILTMSVMLESCGSSRNTATPTRHGQIEKTKRHHKPGAKASHALADALIGEARSWLGTPYRYGGQERDGADCSGFVMQVFKAAANVALPRNSSAQYNYCEDLNRDELEVGDLVFFSSDRSGGNIAHVGMYIGDDKMIHASSSRGVIESSLSLNYYINHYVGAGRVPAVAMLVPVRRKPSEPQVTPEIPEPEYHPESIEMAVADKPEEPVAPGPAVPAPAIEPVTPTVATVTVVEPEPVAAEVPDVSPATVVKNAFSVAASAR